MASYKFIPAKSGRYVEGGRIVNYINGSVSGSRSVRSGDVGTPYDEATGKITPTTTKSTPVTVSAPYYPSKAAQLERGVPLLTGVGLTPPLNGQPATQTQRITGIFAGRNASPQLIEEVARGKGQYYLNKYGRDAQTDTSFNKIGSMFRGEGRYGGLTGIEALNKQADIARSSGVIAAGQTAAVTGYVTAQNRLIGDFNKREFNTPEEYDAARRILDKKLAPLAAKANRAKQLSERATGKGLTIKEGFREVGADISNWEGKQATYQRWQKGALEEKQYQEIVERETGGGSLVSFTPDATKGYLSTIRLTEPGKRVATPTIIGAGFGAILGPPGALAGAAVGSAYGTLDVGARLSSIKLFPGREHLTRATQIPQSGTILPKPTLKQFRVFPSADYKRITKAEDITFKLNTASTMAYGAGLAGVEPAITTAAKSLSKARAMAVNLKTIVKMEPQGEFSRFNIAKEQGYGILAQKSGKVTISQRLDQSILKLNAGRGKGVLASGRGIELYKDTRLVGTTTGPGRPYKGGAILEDITAAKIDIPGVKGGFAKGYSLDSISGQAVTIRGQGAQSFTLSPGRDLFYPLKPPATQIAKTYGVGFGIQTPKGAAGFNVGVSLPKGKPPVLFGQPYTVTTPSAGPGGNILGAGAGKGFMSTGGRQIAAALKMVDTSPLPAISLPTTSVTTSVNVGAAAISATMPAALGAQAVIAPQLSTVKPPKLLPKSATLNLRVSTGSITIPKLKTINNAAITKVITSPRIAQITLPKIGTAQITSVGTRSITLPVTSPVTTPKPITVNITAPITASITAPILNITPPTLPGFGGFNINPPPIPILTKPPAFPGFFPQGGRNKGLNLRFRRPQTRTYKPSVAAIALNISTAKLPKGILSGIGIRPMIKPKKKKRRKR